jgi:ABC-type sugar transport system permease subunit
MQGDPIIQSDATRIYDDTAISRRQKHKEWAWSYLFVAPFVIFYIFLTLWPMIGTVLFSLHDYNGMTREATYIGLENYAEIVQDQVFWRSFVNTLIFAFGNTIIKLPLTLLMAIVLTNRYLRGKSFFRTVYFLPIVVPSAIAGLIFTYLLNPATGALNAILKDIGMIEQSIDFLGSREWGLLSIILISVWQIFGQYLVYWMAALQNVPDEIYEAAQMDGAGFWQQLFYITLPIIRPVATIILFLGIVNALQVFGLVVSTTGGGPGSQTYVVAYFIYNRAFSTMPFRYGYASAGAVFFGIVVLLAVSLQGYFVNRANQQRAEYGV